MSTGKVYVASDQARVQGRRLEFKTRSPGALLTRAPNAGSAGLNSIHADGPGRANGTARNVHRRITRPGEIK